MNQYDKKKLLNYIDAVSFALIDTNLYLDTHPNDKKAMDHFNQYQKARKQALKGYARNFEPLTIDSCLLYTSPSPRDAHESRMPSSA